MIKTPVIISKSACAVARNKRIFFHATLMVLLPFIFLPTRSGAEVLSNANRKSAVEQTIVASSNCRVVKSFYWEIGDAKGPMASGQKGREYDANTLMRVDSASKWVFGAYALEKKSAGKQQLSADILSLLTMTAGYARGKHALFACKPHKTVADCAKAATRDGIIPAAVGKFSYGNAHTMTLAMQLGLGALDGKGLEGEYKKYLGEDLGFEFKSLQLAGGLKATPAVYARFLRAIISGKLLMHGYLGSYAICASADACPGKVDFSPAPVAWHYSLHHWVEDDAAGDGAFSSTGLEGFYPWISADKKLYGILARQSWQEKASVNSALCGIAIRKAWVSGKVTDTDN